MILTWIKYVQIYKGLNMLHSFVKMPSSWKLICITQKIFPKANIPTRFKDTLITSLTIHELNCGTWYKLFEWSFTWQVLIVHEGKTEIESLWRLKCKLFATVFWTTLSIKWFLKNILWGRTSSNRSCGIKNFPCSASTNSHCFVYALVKALLKFN